MTEKSPTPTPKAVEKSKEEKEKEKQEKRTKERDSIRKTVEDAAAAHLELEKKFAKEDREAIEEENKKEEPKKSA